MPRWKGLADDSKSVTVLQGTLQDLDPASPLTHATFIGRVGYVPIVDDVESGFDVVWCQWCLMYMSDKDVVAFLGSCKVALRDVESLIVVKENVALDGLGPNGESVSSVHFDEEDSSVTRSGLAWKLLFEQANLTIVREQVQGGLLPGLYAVNMSIT